MGTENLGRPSFPERTSTTPFASAPPTMTPFSSSGPVVGSEAFSFRPAPLAAPLAAPQSTTPFAGPPVGSDGSGFRPTPQHRFNDPFVSSSPTTYVPPAGGPFLRFPTPQFPSMVQAPPACAPSVGPPPAPPLAGPVSFRPQPPPVPMGSSPQRANFAPPGLNIPQALSDSLF